MDPKQMLFIHDLTQWAPSGLHELIFAIVLQNIKKTLCYVIITQRMPESASGIFEKPLEKVNLAL